MTVFSARHWALALGAALSLQVGAAVWLLPQPPAEPEQGAGGIEISLSLAGAMTAAGGATAPEGPETSPQSAPESRPPEPEPESKPVEPTPVRPTPTPVKKAEQRPEPAPPPQTQQNEMAATRAEPEPTASQRAPASPDDSAGRRATTTHSGVAGANTAAAAGVQAARLDYYSLLAASLNRHKRYPYAAKRARQEGIVRLRFVIDKAGRVVSHEIVGSSGHALLDQAAAEMLKKATPLPAIPDALARNDLTIVLPIEFSLRHR